MDYKCIHKQKSSKGQLLNIEDKSSPQPTPEASFDSNATTASISEKSEKVNTSDEKNLPREEKRSKRK